jgi:acetyl-CoA carboxylase carboxyl transferase subunit beta
MSLFDWFADRRKTVPVARNPQELPEDDGLWSKCSECGLVVYRKDLLANASVCKGCGHHHRIDSEERIRLIADPGSFEAMDTELAPTDPLGFKDRRSYADSIRDSQQSTGLRDAVVTGLCRSSGHPLALPARCNKHSVETSVTPSIQAELSVRTSADYFAIIKG